MINRSKAHTCLIEKVEKRRKKTWPFFQFGKKKGNGSQHKVFWYWPNNFDIWNPLPDQRLARRNSSIVFLVVVSENKSQLVTKCVQGQGLAQCRATSRCWKMRNLECWISFLLLLLIFPQLNQSKTLPKSSSNLPSVPCQNDIAMRSSKSEILCQSSVVICCLKFVNGITLGCLSKYMCELPSAFCLSAMAMVLKTECVLSAPTDKFWRWWQQQGEKTPNSWPL